MPLEQGNGAYLPWMIAAHIYVYIYDEIRYGILKAKHMQMHKGISLIELKIVPLCYGKNVTI